MITYHELLCHIQDDGYVADFFRSLYMDQINLKLFSKQDIRDSLIHPILGKYMCLYWYDEVQMFCGIFQEESLELTSSLTDKTLFQGCSSYLLSTYTCHGIVKNYFLQHPESCELILDFENLKRYLTHNFDGISFLNGLSKDFICDRIVEITNIVSNSFYRKISLYIDEISKDKELYNKLQEEIPNILNSYKNGEGAALFAFLGCVKNHFDCSKVIEENLNQILEVLFSDSMSRKENNPYLEALKMILDEIFEVENKRIEDLEFLNCGAYSNAYRIGDFVLKVGSCRAYPNVPAHPNVLRPIFRRYLKEINLMIEITQYVEPVSKEEFMNQNIPRMLFDKFYQDDLVWLDPKNANIGKIVPLQHPEFFNMYVASESIGFLGDKKTNNESGNYVLLDLDHLVFWSQYDGSEDYRAKLMIKHFVDHYERRN